jgi:hypothetical protein
MSSLDTPISDSAIPDAGNRRDTSTWARWDEWMESVGERLNPILVKEARQALKSRQFGMTFSLLSGAGRFWACPTKCPTFITALKGRTCWPVTPYCWAFLCC